MAKAKRYYLYRPGWKLVLGKSGEDVPVDSPDARSFTTRVAAWAVGDQQKKKYFDATISEARVLAEKGGGQLDIPF